MIFFIDMVVYLKRLLFSFHFKKIVGNTRGYNSESILVFKIHVHMKLAEIIFFIDL